MRRRDGALRRGGILWRLALRTLRANRVRTVVSATGIVAACALATAVLATMSSLSQSLYRRTLEKEGSWYVWCGAASDDALGSLLSMDEVDAVATSCELGCALLDGEAASELGVGSLAVIEMPSYPKGDPAAAEALTRMPELAEGRLPEAPDEIVLPLRMRGMTLVAGEPLGADAAENGAADDAAYGGAVLDGSSGAQSDGPLELGSRLVLELGTRSYEDGMLTFATDERAVSPGEDGRPPHQRLVEAERRTYTVVGFRRPQDDDLGSCLIASRASAIALTCVGGASALAGLPTARQIWASAPGFGDFSYLEQAMGVFGLHDTHHSTRVTSGPCSLHWTLIRYSGLVADREVFDGLNGAAAVLVAAIALAGASLVYTSFAITVGERTRQMGLMASVGASARQLRHLVLFEALVLGLVCIPLGIACGLGGVAAALAATSESFAYLLGSDRGLELCVRPGLLADVAGASALTVLASAWVPALRAGRVPPIEAIRQRREVRMGRAGRREVARARRRGQLPTSADVLPTLAGRLVGVPGFVAHRNLARAGTRGWVVALSLGVSFALVVTAGTVGLYIRPWDELAGTRGADTKADVTLTMFGYRRGDGEGHEALLETAGAMREALSSIEGAQVTGIEHASELQVRIPAAMVSPRLREVMALEDELALSGAGEGGQEPKDLDQLGLSSAHFTRAGDYVGPGSLDVVDEGLWEQLCALAGVDGSGEDMALALDTYQSRWLPGELTSSADGGGATNEDGWHRLTTRAFAAAGEVEVLELDRSLWTEGLEEGMNSYAVPCARDGEPGVAVEYDRDDEWASSDWIALEDALSGSWQLRVVGTTRQLTDALASHAAASSYPQLIVPERTLLAHPALEVASTSVGVASKAPDLERRVQEAAATVPGDFDYYTEPADGGVRQVRAIAFALRLFVTLFAVVSIVIATASAVGTLTSSIGLRVREFAVLRSVGMGPAAFDRMIACECASYAVRGLAIGVVLAAAADIAFWIAMRGVSYTELPGIPWASVGLGAAGVVAVTALTARLALRLSGAATIVDALRADVA